MCAKKIFPVNNEAVLTSFIGVSIQEDLSLDGVKKPADLSGGLQGWSLAMLTMQKAVPALTNLF